MKINWQINYKHQIAQCSQMRVLIKEVNEPITQNFNEVKVGFGFQKIESGRMYQGYIIEMTNELLEQSKNNPQLLPQYGSQLGDSFNEYDWDDERTEDLKIILGKFPKQQELADYLGVNKATVSGYPANKKELMLNGLWVLKKLKSD